MSSDIRTVEDLAIEARLRAATGEPAPGDKVVIELAELRKLVTSLTLVRATERRTPHQHIGDGLIVGLAAIRSLRPLARLLYRERAPRTPLEQHIRTAASSHPLGQLLIDEGRDWDWMQLAFALLEVPL